MIGHSSHVPFHNIFLEVPDSCMFGKTVYHLLPCLSRINRVPQAAGRHHGAVIGPSRTCSSSSQKHDPTGVFPFQGTCNNSA